MGEIALLGVFVFVLVLITYAMLLGAVYKYAKRLGQERTTWVVISLFFSPVVGLIGLYMEGESDEHRKERIMEEERWRKECINGTTSSTIENTPKDETMDTLLNG